MTTKNPMPAFFRFYVRQVDRLTHGVGLVAMYMVFAMMGILLYSSISKTTDQPALWTLEMAQFTMVAYYLLGGGYALMTGSHVRMDLAYGRWSKRTQARMDSLTVLFLIFFLLVLLYGGINSTLYAIKYNEVSRSIWGPQMAPIKIIMNVGIVLTLLQAISVLFKNIATALDRPIA